MISKALSAVLVLTIAMVSSSLASPDFNATEEVLARSDALDSNLRYHVFNDKVVDFFQAWQYCASLGLRMATVNSVEDDAELAVALIRADRKAKGPWWIGGTDLGKEGNFVWITNGKPLGHKTGFTNYAPGEPNNYGGNENCIEVGFFGGTTWNDRGCDVARATICEKVNVKC
ncbi:pulmonary surfactant-associated protein D [Culex quinquefasciatus]|uniref:pulmonary surfactant-associated protein D n=1 Tax=Culex quinquefasciatus TaxID=7176 RepID=UPI0018E29525|nr:pulmonary surfactant-associated protein D [Culex quinquefasciatus]